MTEQLLQNETIKEISNHLQQKLRDNIQHLQKICFISSEECSSLKEQILAMKFYIDQRCQEYSQLIMDVNVKGESRELLKKLADLMTISDLLNEDISYYKDKIKEQEEQIQQLNEQVEGERLKVQILIKDKEELAVILKQEAKLARKDLENELEITKLKLQSMESDFLQQTFNLETIVKQQNHKISDLETGRSSLIKTIQLKEEMYKKQQNHYEQKLSDTKLYWQNKLSEKCQELQNELKESTSQWEIKNKCISNDFDIYRKHTQEQIDLLNFQLIAKDKDYDKLKDQFEKHLQDQKIKENYFNTHKEEHDKEIDNLQSQVTQLKELQINLEQRVNIQNYEINKQIIQFKDSDQKIKKEQQKCVELQNNLFDLHRNFDELQTILQNQNQEIEKLYQNAASYLKLDILSHTPQQMLLFTQEYLQVLIKQKQDLLLEKNELENQIQSQNLEWKQKCNRLTQMNVSQEKRLQDLDKKYADLQIIQLNNSLQKSIEALPEKQEIKIHHFGIHKLEDLQIFLSNLEKSEIVQKQQSEQENQQIEESNEEIDNVTPQESENRIEANVITESNQQSIIEQEQQQQEIENQESEINSEENIENLESEQNLPEKKSSQKEFSLDSEVQSQLMDEPPPPPILIEQKTILLMGSAENDKDKQQNLEESLIKKQNQAPQEVEKENLKSEVTVKVENECLQQVITESITLKEYFEKEEKTFNRIEEKQDTFQNKDILQQKNEIDFHFQKTRNKLRIMKKNPKKQDINLKLMTDNLNRTPETGYETTKISRSTQIQTDWRLLDTPHERVTQESDLNEKETLNIESKLDDEKYMQREICKLSFQLSEAEQDKLRMTLIIEYLQKMLPIPKITQEISTQINNDDQLLKQIELLKVEIEQLQSTSSQQQQELQKAIQSKENEIEDLKDLIVNMSDQIYAYKFEVKENKDIINSLNEKIELLTNQLQDKQQIECSVVVIEKQKEIIENKSLKQQSNTVIVRRETKEKEKEKEKERASTPNKVESNEDFKLKIYQLEKMIRNLNNKIAKKDQLLNQRQNQGELISQLSQMQNMNVEVQELRKQLESKQEQLGKCTTIIKYLEIELENYKSNYNIFNKPKLNTDRTVRQVQQTLPYQVSMSVQQKLPTLQEDMNTTISRSSYKKRNNSLYTNPLENYDVVRNAAKFVKSIPYKGELLNENAIKIICLTLKEIFSKEPNVKRIPTPVTIVGDVHGQLYDVQELLQVGGKPPFTNYLFLGDYVDRGAHSVEVITLLSLLKVKFPNRVTLIRGNHETRGITQNYGFYMECQQKYGNTQAWEYFTDMFDYIPIACIVGTNLLCVHGGLSPCIESVDEIEHLNRFQEIPHEGAFTDIMWSDPDDEDTPGFKISPRGAGFVFGGQVLKEFLHFNDMTHLIRAHQLCNEGFNLKFDDKCITVWSAPNYLYRNGNLASILEIDELGNRYFNIFSESPENMKKDLGTKSMMMGPDNYFT